MKTMSGADHEKIAVMLEGLASEERPLSDEERADLRLTAKWVRVTGSRLQSVSELGTQIRMALERPSP